MTPTALVILDGDSGRELARLATAPEWPPHKVVRLAELLADLFGTSYLIAGTRIGPAFRNGKTLHDSI